MSLLRLTICVEVRNQLGQPARLRRLSQLVFARVKLPVNQAVTLFHPRDGRVMFIIPWEGTTIVGTTDIDHDPDLDKKYVEPFASGDEISYMVCRQNKGIGIILAGILLDRLFHTQGDIRGRPDALLGIRTLSHSLRAGENKTPTLRKTKKITIKPTVPIGLSILTISSFPIRIFLLPLT